MTPLEWHAISATDTVVGPRAHSDIHIRECLTGDLRNLKKLLEPAGEATREGNCKDQLAQGARTAHSVWTMAEWNRACESVIEWLWSEASGEMQHAEESFLEAVSEMTPAAAAAEAKQDAIRLMRNNGKLTDYLIRTFGPSGGQWTNAQIKQKTNGNANAYFNLLENAKYSGKSVTSALKKIIEWAEHNRTTDTLTLADARVVSTTPIHGLWTAVAEDGSQTSQNQYYAVFELGLTPNGWRLISGYPRDSGNTPAQPTPNWRLESVSWYSNMAEARRTLIASGDLQPSNAGLLDWEQTTA